MSKRLTAILLTCNYALVTLTSALLLFEVQPIVSKYILPWFGGSPAVWTTCMVFFQTLLFAGYAYAHASQRLLAPRWQAIVHLSLLGLAAWMLPIAPDASWKLTGHQDPTWRILGLLAVSVGFPYFALSATGPLIQAWFARSFAGRSPYRLYALSNIGSMVGLLGYPFFVEPRFALADQTLIWGLGFLLFALLCGIAAMCASRAQSASVSDSTIDTGTSAVATDRPRWAWMLLPALASMMLLATTNHVCQDVAVMPFLWVAPLSLYLLSFIICFDHPRWYHRTGFAVATFIALAAVGIVDQLITGGWGIAFTFKQELFLHLSSLFLLCMLCHGELYRLRPDPKHLTGFYLMISAGGALGGLFVSLVAPRIFSSFVEWKLGLVFGCLMSAKIILDGQPQSFLQRRFAPITAILVLLFVGINCIPMLRSSGEDRLRASTRNFYGTISAIDRDVDDPELRARDFYSGRIIHGIQFKDPAKRVQPTSYFGLSTGVGQVLSTAAKKRDLRVGIIGLGIGTMACYAREGHYFRFYELNDDVERFAREHFSYLDDCQGTCEVVLGDGRLSLEREEPQQFDVLILDAFSGDAVPTHLLTKEAFEIYSRHLRPGATVAVNISNRYLDLSPVVAGLAERFDYMLRRVTTDGDVAKGQFPADWIVLTRQPPEFLTGSVDTPAKRPILWTDDHSNLFEILK